MRRVMVGVLLVAWGVVAASLYFVNRGGDERADPVQPEPVAGEYQTLLFQVNRERSLSTAAAIEAAVVEVKAKRFTHTSQVFDFVRKRDQAAYAERSKVLSQYAAKRLGLNELSADAVDVLNEMARGERADADRQ
jgi:hypothetical protein